MAEIKFDAARMTEVLNRLEEIKEQLQQSIKQSNESLTQISNNITGSAVITILKGYSGNNIKVLADIEKQLVLLSIYLRDKIGSYVATEEDAVTELQRLLNGEM